MAKFSANQKVQTKHPIRTTAVRTRTHEGGRAYGLDPQSELFLLASVNMVDEPTFYEGSAERSDRFQALVHEVTKADPEWVQRFGSSLRSKMGMRSASVVLAAEYLAASGPHPRQLIADVLQRPDEPAEMLGYWLSHHGRNFPMPLKRGVADAARRLYNERSALRYDGGSNDIRFADVIEWSHAKPGTPTQSALFKYLLDERHHGDGSVEGLGLLASDKLWQSMPKDMRRNSLATNGIPDGWSWERLSGWIPGGMDAAAWEAAIPNMGGMALVRNLRNFDTNKISNKAVDAVIAKITNPEEVKRSRIWPHQVWAGYREAPSDNYKRALGQMLDLATPNTPELPGKTVILIDVSGSMQDQISGRSTLERWELAATMAGALYNRNDATLVIFSNSATELGIPTGTSALSIVNEIRNYVGGGTNLHAAMRLSWDHTKYDRMIVFTDDQAHDSGFHTVKDITPLYIFDIGGYGKASIKSGQDGQFRFGGFSDEMLTAIPVLESGRDGKWPF